MMVELCLCVHYAEVRESYGKVMQRYRNVEDLTALMKQKLQHNSEIYKEILHGCTCVCMETHFYISTATMKDLLVECNDDGIIACCDWIVYGHT